MLLKTWWVNLTGIHLSSHTHTRAESGFRLSIDLWSPKWYLPRCAPSSFHCLSLVLKRERRLTEPDELLLLILDCLIFKKNMSAEDHHRSLCNSSSVNVHAALFYASSCSCLCHDTGPPSASEKKHTAFQLVWWTCQFSKKIINLTSNKEIMFSLVSAEFVCGDVTIWEVNLCLDFCEGH